VRFIALAKVFRGFMEGAAQEDTYPWYVGAVELARRRKLPENPRTGAPNSRSRITEVNILPATSYQKTSAGPASFPGKKCAPRRTASRLAKSDFVC
jgi:hypothetical protein